MRTACTLTQGHIVGSVNFNYRPTNCRSRSLSTPRWHFSLFAPFPPSYPLWYQYRFSRYLEYRENPRFGLPFLSGMEDSRRPLFLLCVSSRDLWSWILDLQEDRGHPHGWDSSFPSASVSATLWSVLYMGVVWTFDKRSCWKWSLETIAEKISACHLIT